MPKHALVYRVLIASPSDVEEERDIIEAELHRWNSLNTADTEIALLPVRWETHAAPEFNAEPQSIINRDLVDSCDIAICVFWSRLGTATSNADSGTIEEIDRMGAAGKLIMMYFSNKQLPYDHDAEQLAKVKKFKENSYSNGLIETYPDTDEFREKVRRHLDIHAKKLETPSSRSKNSTLIKTESERDGQTIVNMKFGNKRTVVEETHQAWKETIIDYLLDQGGPIYGTADHMSEYVFPKLGESDLDYYLQQLKTEKLVEELHSGDIVYYILPPDARDEAMARKIKTNSSRR